MTWEQGLTLPGAPQVGRVLAGLLRDSEWWRLQPEPDAIVQGAGQGDTVKLALRGSGDRRLLVYFPDNSPADVRLPEIESGLSWSIAWFNPRTGAQSPGPSPRGVSAARVWTAEPPEGWDDAVLIVGVARPKGR